jgi:hypothetical protein
MECDGEVRGKVDCAPGEGAGSLHLRHWTPWEATLVKAGRRSCEG